MRDVELAWAYLSRVVEPPCAPLAALVRRVGPAESAERVSRGAVSAELDRLTAARRDIDCAAEDLRRINRMGGRLVTPDDTEWPTASFTAFAGVDVGRHPNGIVPLALWTIGKTALSDIGARSAAVV